MNSAQVHGRTGVALPDDLQRRLVAFRRLVWRVKSIEAICGGLFGCLVGYLLVFGLDRLTETPQWLRLAAFAVALAACSVVPLAFHRWIWSHRALDQVARLIGKRFPSLGDQLLGIIEIVRDFSAGRTGGESGRSLDLCAAAVGQVAAQSRKYDFSAAVPRPRHRLWMAVATVPVAAAVIAGALVPDAAANAWARFLTPWKAVERYTFTRIEKMPVEIVVPHGEPSPLVVRLVNDTLSEPGTAAARIGGQKPLAAPLDGGRYAFTLPPQLVASTLALAVGDVRQRSKVTPMFRPEIADFVAEVTLPAYLERPELRRQDVRGGAVAPVKGSSVALAATANRELSEAAVDGRTVTPSGATVRTDSLTVDEEKTVSIEWKDQHGLSGARPLSIVISPRDDDPPTVTTLDMPAAQDTLLSSDTLRFNVAVRDDFGIRRVGIEWQGVADDANAASEKGDRLLKAGGPTEEAVDAAATFCPDALGVRPQPIVLRAFAEDYLPGRGRVYSTPQMIYVVSPEEYAIVVKQRLDRWRIDVSEVRDREMMLLEENHELLSLPEEQRGTEETRQRLERQAAAEVTQGRKTEQLVEAGKELVREAAKNPEFDPETLEKLAEDLRTLAEIGKNRMPIVAKLLEQAARDNESRAQPRQGRAAPPPPEVGNKRDKQPEQIVSGSHSQPPYGPQPLPVPQLGDKESSLQPKGALPEWARIRFKFGLLGTSAGVMLPVKNVNTPHAIPAVMPLEESVAAQEKLLEDFAKVAGELAQVMAGLEHSTFVKRLKLASRQQGLIAERITGMPVVAFDNPDAQPAAVQRMVEEVSELNAGERVKVSNLMDDLQAYLDNEDEVTDGALRKRLPAFRGVLEEMKDLKTLRGLQKLSNDIKKQPGLSIAQAEFWSDTFDRLADDLVPPRSLRRPRKARRWHDVPADVVLEVARILEAEVNLREETRIGEQTRKDLPAPAFAGLGRKLGAVQDQLAKRTVRLLRRLLEEEDAHRNFPHEIILLEQVEKVMGEASSLLSTPDTGPKAIAAETMVIEMLLKWKSAVVPSRDGSDSRPDPDGGESGTTNALAELLAGQGNGTNGVSEHVEKGHTIGQSGRVLPDEFRSGLDAYFNRFENERR